MARPCHQTNMPFPQKIFRALRRMSRCCYEWKTKQQFFILSVPLKRPSNLKRMLLVLPRTPGVKTFIIVFYYCCTSKFCFLKGILEFSEIWKRYTTGKKVEEHWFTGIFKAEKEVCSHELLVGTRKNFAIDFSQFWHAAQKRLPTPALDLLIEFDFNSLILIYSQISI